MSSISTVIRLNHNYIEYLYLQKNIIDNYIKENNIDIKEQIEYEFNYKTQEENLLNLKNKLQNIDTIIIYDLNVLGRTTQNVINSIEYFLDNNIRIISINQNLELVNKEDILTKIILGIVKITINLEKDLMSLRTKESLIDKKIQGIHLGKPKGTIQKSKFDDQREKIEELLKIGLSIRKISKLLGYNNHIGLNTYIKKRAIRLNIKKY
jgi:putative DNA-invertase from lambdoid prophage Rac